MIKKENKIKNTILLMILLILITSGIVISFYQNILVENHLNSEIEIKDKQMHKTFNLLLNSLKDEISRKSDFMIDEKIVRETFAKRDREKLYLLLKDKFYKRMIHSNPYLKILTFRLPDGSAFLRVHKPEMYGDRLNKKRQIILDTIKTQKRQIGFEVGKLKMTYRVVTPIFYENKFVGLVEMGVEPEFLTSKLRKLFDVKSALLVKKEFKDVSLSSKDMKTINKYMLARGDTLFENNLEKIDFNKITHRLKYNNNEYLIHTDINLNDNKNKPAAKILAAYSLKDYNSKKNELIFKNIIYTLIVISMLFLVLNIGMNYFLKKINNLYKDIIKKDKMMLQQSKLASMGEMIGNIAHQWRQPLSVISTCASGIKIQNEIGILDTKILNHSVDNIVSSTKYLSQTIDDFRDFIKGDKKADIFSLEENIYKNLEILKGTLSINEIDVKFESKKDILITNFDNELTQAFINIIQNAKDALIEKENLLNRYIFISLEKDVDFAVLKIKDNAGGIPANIINKVFEPYFTTKHSSQGTGLGLYMTFKIIQDSMHGSIDVKNVKYSYEGVNYTGAEFTIRFFIN